MSRYQTIARAEPGILETNKVLRNTCALLAITLNIVHGGEINYILATKP